jgi:membrane protein YdbS with pleckstrin-like domain
MNTYNKIMKMFWLVFAVILFVVITFKGFSEGFERWWMFYPFVLLAVGMYFFKIWMMKRMEKHIAYMREKESSDQELK